MKHQRSILRGLLVSFLVFAVITAAAIGLIQGIDNASGHAETELVRDAVRAATLSCYAVEGMYPSSLDYLKENYGLVYDESLYVVSYDAFSSNIFPDIVVMEGGDGLQ